MQDTNTELWNDVVDRNVTELVMGKIVSACDDVWKIEMLVDDDGDLCIWVQASDEGKRLRIVDSGADIADNEDSWAVRLVHHVREDR